jgi:hypothetical protein
MRRQIAENKSVGSSEGLNVGKAAWVTPQGNADDCENKRVAEKAIRKNMKTKDEQRAGLKV